MAAAINARSFMQGNSKERRILSCVQDSNAMLVRFAAEKLAAKRTKPRAKNPGKTKFNRYLFHLLPLVP